MVHHWFYCILTISKTYNKDLDFLEYMSEHPPFWLFFGSYPAGRFRSPETSLCLRVLDEKKYDE